MLNIYKKGVKISFALYYQSTENGFVLITLKM